MAYHAAESSGGGAGDADTPATAVSADVVIMTTGGFGANRDMLRAHNPSVDGFATTNGQWATGRAPCSHTRLYAHDFVVTYPSNQGAAVDLE